MVTKSEDSKKLQRKELLKKRDAQDRYLKEINSEKICKRLESMLPTGAKTLFVYASVRSEVVTYLLIERMWARGIQVALPRVEGKDLKFYTVRNLSWLQKSDKTEIPEPVPEVCSEADVKDSVMAVPVVGFDENGNRMGYGGGFYDRYLEKNRAKHLLIIGMAFELQYSQELICDKKDQRLDMIITENRIIKI